MKHIGWCLENIQIAFAHMPRELTTEELKKKAKEIIKQVEKYSNTLINLVHNSDFRKTIKELEHVPLEGIRLRAHEVEELAKDIEHSLYVIDLTLKELDEISSIQIMSEEYNRRWKRSYDKVVLMIEQKFGGEMGELRKEFNVSVHTKEQLQKIVNSEEHLAEFLK